MRFALCKRLKSLVTHKPETCAMHYASAVKVVQGSSAWAWHMMSFCLASRLASRLALCVSVLERASCSYQGITKSVRLESAASFCPSVEDSGTLLKEFVMS